MNVQLNSKVVQKYLNTHAESCVWLGAELVRDYAQVVVIPAYGEDCVLDQAIASVPSDNGEPTLTVIVINDREDSPQSVRAINRATIARLNARYDNTRRIGRNAHSYQTPSGDLVILEVTLPRDQGVGLARKHGADFAFGAWTAGKLHSSWIHCTDADVHLPENYFCAPQAGAVAALHRFRHEATERSAEAHVHIYDLWLRLHVLGLHWAGSPYGFHTIGSTITVDAYSYAAVRGFPKRNAAEDFYFLNKLAKLGPIICAASAPLHIAARVSDRVPFGTGRTLGRVEREGPRALPRFYDPRIYVYLKSLLRVFDQAIEAAAFDPAWVFRSLTEQGLDTAPMTAAIDALGLHTAICKLLCSSADGLRRRRAVHGWFDAFRTMKFIHLLRDNGIASVDLITAASNGNFLLHQSAPAVNDDIGVVRGLLQDLSWAETVMTAETAEMSGTK